ncbi:MAG TPA: transglutaminase domain-containing protein, partial [Promineifilum sp.]|nr:transglutaminase domain-containing protein [Promineifilum sp.]
VPARVVSGYALGEYTPEAKNYRVRAVNAHTWVEVYFPGYGWIYFEPTQSIPVVERPESGQVASGLTPPVPVPDANRALTDDELSDLERANGLLDGTDNQQNQGLLGGVPWWQVATGATLLIAAAAALWMANRYNQKVEGDVGRSFLRLGEWARVLGLAWRPTQTPYEQADTLVAVVPQGQQPIRNLTRQYVLQLFSPTRSMDADFDPRQEWRQLRPMLIRRGIVNTLNRTRGQKK